MQRRDAAAQAVANDAPGDVGDALDREPELLEDRAGGRRRAEVVEPDDRPLVADPALPAERDAGLDADALADARRQDRVAVRLVLGLERSQQGSDTTRGRMPSASSVGRGRERELQLRARSPMRISSGVAAGSRRAAHSRRARTPSRACSAVPASAGSFWRVSASADRPASSLDGQRPGGDRLVGVARPDEPQVRDRAQRRVVLDRLVGRAVLAEPDGVVRPDVDDVQPGQRREADRAAHVVAEGQERGAVRDEAAVIGDAVGDAAHGVLADAEPEVPARRRRR